MPIIPPSENISHYFRSTIPEVNFKKITLETAGGPTREQLKMVYLDDPHIKVDEAVKNTFLNKAWAENQRLHVTIDLEIKTVIPKTKDIYSSYVFQEDFAKYFKVLVFQNQVSGLYDLIMNYHDTQNIWVNNATPYLEKFQIPRMSFPDGKPPHSTCEGCVHKIPENNVMFDAFNSMPVSWAKHMASIKSAEDIKNLGDKNIKMHAPTAEMLTNQQSLGALVNDFDRFIDNDGNTIINIPFTMKFELENGQISPQHLSYIAMTYLDVRELEKDFGNFDSQIYPDVGLHADLSSRLIPIRVINNRKVETTMRVFTLEDETRKLWTGPVHSHGDEGPKQWMTGEYHQGPTDPNPSKNLSVSYVRNEIVQDFRSIIQSLKLDPTLSNFAVKARFSQLGAAANTAVNPQENLTVLNNDNILELQEDSSYFSNLCLSRDNFDAHAAKKIGESRENIRFFFGFDVVGLLRKNSVFGEIFYNDNPPPQAAEGMSIFSTHSLRSWKHTTLYRKRVRLKPSTNKIGFPVIGVEDYDINEEPVIVFSGDANQNNEATATGNAKFQNRSDLTLGKWPSDGLHMGANNSNHIWHITGIDYIGNSKVPGQATSNINITDGHYMYYLEMELEDETVIEMSNIYNEILDFHQRLGGYYQRAQGSSIGPYLNEIVQSKRKGKPNYNIRTNKFIDEFANEILQAGPPLSRFSSNGNSDLILDLQKYIKYYRVLFSKPIIEAQVITITAQIAKLIAADTGTLKGIETLLKHVEDFLNIIQTSLDSLASGPVLKTPQKALDGSGDMAQPPARFKLQASKRIKIRHNFNQPEEIVDANVPKNTGYDFLRGLSHAGTDYTLSEGNIGLCQTSVELYKNRVDGAIAYYSNNPSAIPVAKMEGITTATEHLIDVNKKRYTYLTPGTIYRPNVPPAFVVQRFFGKNSNISSAGAFPWLEFFLDDLRFNNVSRELTRPFQISSNSELGPYGQRIRNNLLDLFANGKLSNSSYVNCTVESMLAFGPTPEKNINVNEQKQLENAPTVIDLEQLGLTGQIENEDDIGLDTLAQSNAIPHIILQRLQDIFTSPTPLPNFDLNSSQMFNIENIQDLPIQLKYIIAKITNDYTLQSATNLAFVQGKYNDSTNIDFNAIQSADIDSLGVPAHLYGWYYYYFFNINRVEVFRGYEVVEGITQMKGPIWTDISSEDFSLGVPLLCRQMPYVCPLGNFGKPPHIGMPLYNKYFIITPEATESGGYNIIGAMAGTKAVATGYGVSY